jgi:ankyrin repeat protein
MSISTFTLHDLCELGDLYGVYQYLNEIKSSPAHNETNNNQITLFDEIINERDPHNMTPLHIAITNGRAHIVMILMSFGCDLTLSCEGMPILHMVLTLCGSFQRYQLRYGMYNGTGLIGQGIQCKNQRDEDAENGLEKTQQYEQHLSQLQQPLLKYVEESYGHQILSFILGPYVINQCSMTNHNTQQNKMAIKSNKINVFTTFNTH